jgi:uncharacterized protein YecT (DUF1311 family)
MLLVDSFTGAASLRGTMKKRAERGGRNGAEKAGETLPGALMRFASVLLITAVFAATAASAQQAGPPNQVGVPKHVGMCGMARTAAARLICADPDLAARDSKLAAAYRQTKSRLPPAAQKDLLKQQLMWMRDRAQKCGLVGKDLASIDELRAAKPCMQNEIEARLAQLQGEPDLDAGNSAPAPSPAGASAAPPATPSPQTIAPGPAVHAPSLVQSVAVAPMRSPISAPGNQDIVITPTTTVAAGQTGSGQFRFAASASRVSGTADCGTRSPSAGSRPADAGGSAKPIVKITLADDANSYQLFENDTWRAVLEEVRNAVHAACSKASRAANNGSEATSALDDRYEVDSSQGLFVAQSEGVNGAWRVEANVPQTRQKLQTDLGIQKWIKPSELARNPYFFKDMVVGMIVRIDRKISDSQAVFARSSAQIFVADVPHEFADRDMVVLAGRVMGNKGVVDPSGSEELLPAVAYVGTANCANVCETLSGLAAP